MLGRERERETESREIEGIGVSTFGGRRARTASHGGGGQRGGRSFPSLAGIPRSVGGGGVARLCLGVRALVVPPPFYSRCDRGPNPTDWSSAPDQGAGSWVTVDRWVQRLEINLTFSPLISTLLLSFTLLISPQIDT